jgi:hypothetical protein
MDSGRVKYTKKALGSERLGIKCDPSLPTILLLLHTVLFADEELFQEQIAPIPTTRLSTIKPESSFYCY